MADSQEAKKRENLENVNFAFLNVSHIKEFNETLFLAFEGHFLEERLRPCE